MQHIDLIGFVSKEPEFKTLDSGLKLMNFSLGVNIRQRGEEKVVWYSVAGKACDFEKISSYLTKGKGLLVKGALEVPYVYQTKDGVSAVKMGVWAHSINFLPKGSSQKKEESNENSLF